MSALLPCLGVPRSRASFPFQVPHFTCVPTWNLAAHVRAESNPEPWTWYLSIPFLGILRVRVPRLRLPAVPVYVWGAEVQVPLLLVIEIPPRWNLLSLT